MWKLKQLFERTMLAITFAEAGEFNTALDYLYDREEERVVRKNRKISEDRPQLRV